jgi:hypothetical protein
MLPWRKTAVWTRFPSTKLPLWLPLSSKIQPSEAGS